MPPHTHAYVPHVPQRLKFAFLHCGTVRAAGLQKSHKPLLPPIVRDVKEEQSFRLPHALQILLRDRLAFDLQVPQDRLPPSVGRHVSVLEQQLQRGHDADSLDGC